MKGSQLRGFPGGPVVTTMFPLQGVQVGPLAGELESPVPSRAVKNAKLSDVLVNLAAAPTPS